MAHVLLIEDDAVIRLLLKRTMERAGHYVTEAGDGAAGVQHFNAAPADIVVTDVLMPLMNGLEVISVLRRWNATVPILAISGGMGANDKDILRVALECGANRTLAKPFAMDEFMLVLHTLLVVNGIDPIGTYLDLERLRAIDAVEKRGLS